MKHLRERILALGMALCLCLSLCAVSANAAGEEAEATITLTVTVGNKSGSNYPVTYKADTVMAERLAKAAEMYKDAAKMKDLRFTCTLEDKLTAKQSDKTLTISDREGCGFSFTSAKYTNGGTDYEIFVLDGNDAVKVEDGKITLRYKLNETLLNSDAWKTGATKTVVESLCQQMHMEASMDVSASTFASISSKTFDSTARIDITMKNGGAVLSGDGIKSIFAAYGETSTTNPEYSSGGGGGSSGGGTTTITVPVSGDENKVNVSATVSGNNATVKELTDQEIERVIGADVETGVVEIDVSGLGKNISSATLPTTTVDKIADATKETGNDASGMSVKLSTATVTFDAAATQEIAEQAKGSTIQLVVDDIKEGSLNTAQKATVEKLDTALVIDAYLVSNGTRLCSESKGGFGGGKATVALPYEIESNRSAANYSVYYVDDAGKLEKLNATYDTELGAFVFDITHFSNYVVAYEKNASAFVDVKTSDYFYNAVLWAAKNGITNGVDAVHFGPGVPVTRAQVVTFLWRAAGCPVVDYWMRMDDVKSGEYYSEAVRWALSEGITKGTSDTTFSPDMVCTRGQIVTFLARFAGVEDAETASVFTDVQATDYFAAAVKWAKDNGVTSGTSATTFSPNRNCTRAEVVTFLYRWMVR